MRELKADSQYCSPFADLMAQFVQEGRSCGYRYETESTALRQLDRFLCDMGLTSLELPKSVVESWTEKRSNDRPRTHQARISIVRRFGLFLRRKGRDAYVPEARITPVIRPDFHPYIFRHDEIKKIVEAADRIPPEIHAHMRDLITPEVFRLLYSCGMRVSEVLHLRVSDVDLTAGILTVRRGKFDKDRLVPLAASLTARLRKYASALGERGPEAIFFPAPDGGPYSKRTIYGIFRRLLRDSGIPHGGKGKGPRLHDL
jgi:integrase